jgi:hypothetical protein
MNSLRDVYMKVSLMIILFILFPVFATAANSLDASDGNPTNAVYVDDAGKVGVGTTTPAYQVEVVGDVLQISNGTHNGYFRLTSSNGSIEIASGNDSNSYIDFKGAGNEASDYIGRLLFHDTKGFTFLKSGGGVKVGINTANPQSTLAVLGKITAKEVEVTNTGWADYVFNPNYNLMPLSDVKKHIEQYGHLPDIASAKEVEEKGLNLGESQAKLLQKIEELTLYVISLNEQVLEQKKEIYSLRQAR